LYDFYWNIFEKEPTFMTKSTFIKFIIIMEADPQVPAPQTNNKEESILCMIKNHTRKASQGRSVPALSARMNMNTTLRS